VLADSFEQIWTALFTTPVNLDSALYKFTSKLSPEEKSILVQVFHALLLRPVSTAEQLGIGLKPGEPWILDDRVGWKTARQVARRLATEGLSRIKGPGKEEDFPPSMVEEWKQSWGDKVAAVLIDRLGLDPPLSLRVKFSASQQSIAKELRAEASRISPLGVYYHQYTPVMKTEAYERGDIEIQDEGSQFLSLFTIWPEIFGKFLNPSPTLGFANPKSIPERTPVLTIIDACAGAGGKTLALADLLKNKGRVYAYDVSERKLAALKKRVKRGNYNNVQAVCIKDMEDEVTQRFSESADIVLVDAPCSGWGVLRRNPDIKWRQTRETLDRMPEIQMKLLLQYSKLVKPGGSVVYGVCTFRPDETKLVTKRFLEENSQFQLKADGYLGPGHCDGFYMAALVKTK
jgi:16S rRNA C967 or C1407 C5-methylase (RsmB/RsmF family)